MKWPSLHLNLHPVNGPALVLTLPVTLMSMSKVVFPLEFFATMVYKPESCRFELGMISVDVPSTLTMFNHGDTGSLSFNHWISGTGEAYKQTLSELNGSNRIIK